MLDIWPTTFSIDLCVFYLHELNEDNVIAILERNDRIREIHVQNSDKDSFQRLATSMQFPFPALTDLSLANFDFPSPPVPDSFLGGSAPSLRSLCLDGIAVLGLPNLLLSATSLICLHLEHIPHPGPGYISPYVMADCLSSLARLQDFEIEFKFTSEPYPYQTSLRPPPLRTLTRTTLPKLANLFFEGMSEYFEVLFSWIDAPRHKDIYIQFFNPVNFDISHISPFIGREELIIEDFGEASMSFYRDLLEAKLTSRKGATASGGTSLQLSVKRGDSTLQLQSLSRPPSRNRILSSWAS